ncbi:MAG: hypothetical protein Q7J26_02460 [Brevundimonas sp.]|uniref:glycine-rich domain-containing protein n=1 Tax=Brevundimonas sp. TaxID=1871086 RepID=UPI002727F456|nr:hypothetical protein [Brevundimonas sp.]MDO9607361.1 hypothetical protein [Brevundimonas sp.]
MAVISAADRNALATSYNSLLGTNISMVTPGAVIDDADWTSMYDKVKAACDAAGRPWAGPNRASLTLGLPITLQAWPMPGDAIPDAQTLGFDRTTSWTAPSGVNSVMFNWIVAGGGGGGAGTEYGNGGGGGGGGSGGFGRYIEVPCKPGDKFVFTIGAGGIGAATPTVNGKPSNNLPVRDGSLGGQTTVTQNGAVIFTATGGEGGITSRNTNQAAQVSQGGTGGLPSGLTGQLGPGGTNDRASTFGGGGAPGPTQGSFGGAGGLAGGGGDRVTGASAGKAGVGHGSGGGGGGCKDRYDGGGYWFGGQGANGFVEITFPSQGAVGGTPAAINTTYNTTAPVTAGGSTGGGYTGGSRGNGLESFVVTMQSV